MPTARARSVDVPPLACQIEASQFLLKWLIEQLVLVRAEKRKQFCFPNAFHDLFFLLGEFH